MASLLDDEAVPVALVPPIELFFDLASDVRKVRLVVVLERFQARDDRRLLLLRRHVCSLY